jgi:hypothetical protein
MRRNHHVKFSRRSAFLAQVSDLPGRRMLSKKPMSDTYLSYGLKHTVYAGLSIFGFGLSVREDESLSVHTDQPVV